MKILQLIPIIIGVAVLLLGIYLVSTNGYLDGKYLPSLIGIQPCTSSPLPNVTGCTGFSSYGGYGVGTIVCIFGLSLIGGSVRRIFASPTSGGANVTPEAVAAIIQAQNRPPAASGVGMPGPKPGTIYCHNCGSPNPTEAKFCHQCASAMPGASPPAAPPSPPSVPPGAGS